MLVTKKIEIDMGHRVPNHKSKCRNLHGHRYTIEVGVDDKIIADKGASSEGMVIDFSDLKAIMMSQLDDKYDHAFTMYDQDILVNIFKTIHMGGEVLHKLMKLAASIFNRDYEEPEFQRPQKINFVPFVPTAENLATHWYLILKEPLALEGIKIHHVTVWETPSSTATYAGE